MSQWIMPPILSETGRVRPKLLLNTAKDYMSGLSLNIMDIED